MPKMAKTVVRILLLFSTLTLSGCIDLSYSVQEEQTPPVILGNVETDSSVLSLIDTDQQQNLKYSILNTAEGFTTNFDLEVNTGLLKLGKKLDREALCNSAVTCVLQLSIAVASSDKFITSIKVNVTVLDTNDHRPVFSRSSISVPISERSSVNLTFPIIGATDRDAVGLNNSKILYDIYPNSETFGLKLVSSSQGSTDINLILKQTVDREKLDHYQIYVVATDRGIPPLSSSLTVDITVEDYNDNKPVFTQNRYNATVREDVAVDTVIEIVVASDLDAADNGKVKYEFTFPQTLFKLNEESGEISVIQQLTYSAAPMELSVRAYDLGTPQQTSLTMVDVHIIDINNHDPEINIRLLSTSSSATVEENSNIGTLVAYVSVQDKDSSNNGKVNCSIKSSKFSLLRISNSEYTVVTAEQLDREEKIEYVITVVCEDNGQPRRNHSASFIVEVLDKNDNMPIFMQSVYYGNLTENNEAGKMVTRVSASDMDQGVNAEVRYFVERDFADMFYVEPTSGVIKANVRFDREQVSEVKFKVLAMDSGEDIQYTSNTTVILTIIDDNDEYPVFTQTKFNFSITENKNADTLLGNLSATDKDIGMNGQVTYSLPSQHQMTLPFVVFPNGTVKSNRPLNRELKSSYDFIVMATDRGVPALSSTAKVSVLVLDENDNYPQIIYPVKNNGTVTVSHLTPPGNEVTKIDAYDLDEGRNGALVFSMSPSSANELFYIEETSGKIYLAKEIRKEDIKDYNLMIEVSDKGIVPKKSGADITLRVEFTVTEETSQPGIGQNVLIAITIACVTIVLSLAILVTIFLIRRADSSKGSGRGSLTEHEEVKVTETLHIPPKKPCLAREGARPPLPDNNNSVHYEVKKEVSFSMDDHDHRDSGIFMIANDHSSPVPMTKLSKTRQLQTFISQQHSNRDIPERRGENPAQDELHRMASIRLHEKLMHSYNKPLVYHPDENRQLLLLKKGLEDSRSDNSGEVTTDSGRGGSEEDMHHASIMI
ncbi:protocadherin-11 X-linked-like isoform X1 [Pecten maximus]|uniref:protocadherin-11 X-linked-like isoform X1 n=1 Tax=Pecten maximus TaxID=6579 RepID=UPI0014586BE1|nr:protocadherin-11 X-linked-like isoform X1 [Pecten maximus]XP_033743636.1 protocadherin-11 X-linked-like isoform X1 [Pecten maximus]